MKQVKFHLLRFNTTGRDFCVLYAYSPFFSLKCNLQGDCLTLCVVKHFKLK